MEVKLYSPVLCEFFTNADILGNSDVVYPKRVSQEFAASYVKEIHNTIVALRLPEDAERGQMSYYYGGGSVDEKVRSLDFDVEVHGGKLWGVATLDISEPLTPAELDTIRGFIKNQYANGFGEGFWQEDIKVNNGSFNIHLWTSVDDFFIDTQEQFAHRLEIEPESANAMLPDPTGTGYVFAVTDDSDFYLPNVLHVQRDDELFIFPDDETAARAAEMAGVSLIYGMPDVPDGVYIDTPENRAAIKDYFERERLAMPASDELTQKLHERLDANYADYRAGMLRLNSSEVFADAAEIVAVCQSYEFFRDKHTVTVGQAELLLKYADPLDFISDCWIHSPVVSADEITGILEAREKTHSGFYERATAASTPGVKSLPQQNAVDMNEKVSVMDRIKRAAMDARNRSAIPKDKSNRNKSEPEH